MLTIDSLKLLLHKNEYSRMQKLLFCLAVDSKSPKQVREICGLAQSAGFHPMKKWNVSDILTKSEGLAIRTPEGWELSTDGGNLITRLVGEIAISPPQQIATVLRNHLSSIADTQIKSFVAEAIECYERGLHRAAIVLSWVGALSVLQEYVIHNRLSDFNYEAQRRDTRWKNAKTREDFGRMKEFDFLQILSSISMIDQSVKLELEKRLQLRNSCGHPTALRLSSHAVAAHIEILILNVFAQFAI